MRFILLCVFSFNVAFSMNTDLAAKRCRLALQELRYADNHQDVEHIKRMKELVDVNLKKFPTAKQEEVLPLLTNCMDGISSISWMIKQTTVDYSKIQNELGNSKTIKTTSDEKKDEGGSASKTTETKKQEDQPKEKTKS